MKNTVKNTLKKTYKFITSIGCFPNIFHFQFHATRILFRDLKKELAKLEGDVLDFGCGKKPYKTWFKKTGKYVGVDLFNYPDVDVLVKDGKIPLEDNSFDVVISTQVFEHTESLDYLSELHRVLKPGGKIVVTVPFLYQVHDDLDFRRFTKQGLEKTMIDYSFEVEALKTQGGVGSTLAIIFLGYFDLLFRQNINSWKGLILLPLSIFWILILTPVINILGLFIDWIDDTERFYNNLIVISKK